MPIHKLQRLITTLRKCRSDSERAEALSKLCSYLFANPRVFEECYNNNPFIITQLKRIANSYLNKEGFKHFTERLTELLEWNERSEEEDKEEDESESEEEDEEMQAFILDVYHQKESIERIQKVVDRIIDFESLMITNYEKQQKRMSEMERLQQLQNKALFICMFVSVSLLALRFIGL